MILQVDTTNFESALLTLKDQAGKVMAREEFKSGRELSEKLLLEIQKLLTQNQIKLSDLTGIEVNTSTESSTSARVCLAVANALSFVLRIPINGKLVGKIASL